MTFDDAFRDGVEWRDKNPLKTPWNDVKKRLPQGNRNTREIQCLVCSRYGDISIVKYSIEHKHWLAIDMIADNIVKWMYIPNIK